MTTKKTSSEGSKAVVAGDGSAGSTVPSSIGTTPTIVATTPTAVPPKGFQEDLQQMLQGFQKFLPVGSVLALYPAIATAKQATSQAVATLHAAVPGAHALRLALKDALIGFYGRGSPSLAEFGVAPKTRAKPSALQSAVAAAKGMQTRQTNGTLGKRQKATLALATAAQAAFAPSAQPQSASSAVPAKPQTSGQ